MTRKRRLLTVVAALLAVLALTAVLVRPRPDVVREDPYFTALQSALRARNIARPSLIIDLDRVDGNLAVIRQVLGSELRFRATTKSLPSYELLRHVLSAMDSERVMEFHGPYLRPLIENLGRPKPLDILLGKPLPASELEAFFERPPSQGEATIRWLIDSEERLDSYLAVAQKRVTKIPIALELDVGLHRGGLAEPAVLGRVLEKLGAHQAVLKLTGVMGYEGHVPHAPPLGTSTESAQAKAFADSIARLTELLSIMKRSTPYLIDPDFIVNAGGSKTLSRYRQNGRVVGPATELAMGSAVLKPSDFDVPGLSSLQPAIYIAEPVLKRLSPGRLPFAEWLGALWTLWNPNRHDVVYVYGGGWDLRPVYPQGLYSNPLYNDRPADNRIPNQTLLNVARSHPLRPSDFVFYRPLQSDIMTQFDELLIVRGGQIVATWHPLPRRL